MIAYDKIHVDEDDALRELEMIKKKQQILKRHPYKIYYSEKSGWFTQIDTPYGKKKIRKSTEKALMDELASVYLDIKIQTLYEAWIELKRNSKNASNIKRIEADWHAYYENEPLSQKLLKKPLREITTKDLQLWAKDLLEKHDADYKKFNRMFYVINQVYEYAIDDEVNLVDRNLWQVARKKIDRSLLRGKSTPSDDTQVFTNDERLQIWDMVMEDMKKYSYNPTSAGLQILLMLETGVRIGEACGLKWSDVEGDWLHIQRQANNERVIPHPKTEKGNRRIPLTDKAKEVLRLVQDFNEEHHLEGEWIFQSCGTEKYDGRLSYNAADRKLRKLCVRLNTKLKSPHKCRKTFASLLVQNPDVTPRSTQSYMGHKDIHTTLMYYAFNTQTEEEQANAARNALSLAGRASYQSVPNSKEKSPDK